jgi:hypothetical protein
MTFNTMLRIYTSRLEAVPLTAASIVEALRAAGDRAGSAVTIIGCAGCGPVRNGVASEQRPPGWQELRRRR